MAAGHAEKARCFQPLLGASAGSAQNRAFNPNCKILGSWAPLITPNELVPTVVPGLLKLTLLNALKNSARNCVENRSLIFVVFKTPMLVLKNLGPRRMFLPELPKVPTAFRTNTEVSKNCL